MLRNPNNLKQLSDTLSEILETPVSEKILALTTEPQRNKLVYLIGQWEQGKDYEEATMCSILNYGKQKLPPREYSDKVNALLINKGLK